MGLGHLGVDDAPLRAARTALADGLRREFDLGFKADRLVDEIEALVKAKIMHVLMEIEIRKLRAR